MHLLLVAHGSRRAASNAEIETLAKKLSYLGSEYQGVEFAFLELAEPRITDALETMITKGAESILVLPYFLAAGNHVAKDVPAEIAEVKDAYPDVEIKVAPHIGAADDIPILLLRLAANAH